MLRIDLVHKLVHFECLSGSDNFAAGLLDCSDNDLLWNVTLKRNSILSVAIDDLNDGTYKIFITDEQRNKEEKPFVINH